MGGDDGCFLLAAGYMLLQTTYIPGTSVVVFVVTNFVTCLFFCSCLTNNTESTCRRFDIHIFFKYCKKIDEREREGRRKREKMTDDILIPVVFVLHHSYDIVLWY